MNNYLSEKFKVISFLAMILVVVLHSYNAVVKSLAGNIVLTKGYSLFIQNFFSQGVSRIAVPLFFAISGYLFFLNINGNVSEFFTKIKKRIRTLVVPYLFWSLWALGVYFALQCIPQSKPFFTNNLIKDYTPSQLLYTVFIDPIAYQLWFIRELLIILLLSPVIYWLLRYLKWSIVMVCIILWYLNVNYIFVYNEAVMSFVLGGFFSVDQRRLLLNDFSSKGFFYFFIWISILLCKTILMHLGAHTDDILIDLLHKTGILTGIVAVWSMYDTLLKKQDLTTSRMYSILPFSFFLYAFHEPILVIFKKGLFYLIGKGEMASLLIYIIAPLVTILLSLFIGFNLKRFLPKVYAVITGGR